MMIKRRGWLFVFSLLLFCFSLGLFSMNAMATEETIIVYVSVAIDGELQQASDNTLMAYLPVNVRDFDSDGKLTVKDVIAGVHEQYYTGYSEANKGYTYDDTKLTSLWGQEKDYWVFLLGKGNGAKANSVVARTASTTNLTGSYGLVQNGYCVTLSNVSYPTITTNKCLCYFVNNAVTSTLSSFISEITVQQNQEFSVFLAYRAQISAVALGNYNIYYSSNGKDLQLLTQTDTKGVFSAKFTEAGDYILTAKTNNNGTIYSPPVLVVHVVANELTLKDIKLSFDENLANNLLLGFDSATKEYTITIPENCTTLYGSVGSSVQQTPTQTGWLAQKLDTASSEWSKISIYDSKNKNIVDPAEHDSIHKFINIGAAAEAKIILTDKYVNYSLLSEYLVHIKRIAMLGSMDFDVNGTMEGEFDPAKNDYTIYVDENATNLGITLSGIDTAGVYTITINGQKIEANQQYSLDLIQLDFDEQRKAKVYLVVEKTGDEYINNTYTLTIFAMPKDDEPKFVIQPENAEYVVADAAKNQTVKPLQVLAGANGNVTYQWYCIADDTAATLIADATESSYTPKVENIGDYYYYCVAGNEASDGKIFYTPSSSAFIKVYGDPTPKLELGSQIPALNSYGSDIMDFLNSIYDVYDENTGEVIAGNCPYTNGYYYKMGESAEPISLRIYSAADPEGGADYTIRWQRDKKGSFFSHSLTYAPETDLAYGARLFYVDKVSVDFLGQTYSTTYTKGDSPVEAFVFVDKGDNSVPDSFGLTGSGTKNDPYLISGLEDIKKIQEQVNNGYTFEDRFFKMTADITLPKNFAGIGAAPGESSSKGVDLLPFSGTLDGGNHTLTYEYGSQYPLFNCVREATVQNLNIYAPYIANYGLVANYVIDYGPDGSYSAGFGGSVQAGTPDTIDIINVTIKEGSNILKSGFIGGNGSGGNVVNIINCKAEADVNIGYNAEQQAAGNNSGIGTFAGSISGTLVNCESQANVYGNNAVGGIVGAKGQAMGPFEVRNSSFTGTIIASGQRVGGIVGGGYNANSAPNTPCVTVTNCYVAADICGNDRIGGIIGGEPGTVQSWGEAYVRNNFYYGKITGAAGAQSVGSIIGYMNGLNKYSIIESNYYLDSCGTDMPIGSAKYIDTSAEHGSEPEVIYVDTSKELPGIAGFSKKDLNRTDDPLGKDREKLAQAMTAAQFMDGTVLGLLNGSATGSKNWTQGELYPVFDQVKVIPVALIIGGEYKAQYYIGEALDMSGAVFTLNMSDGSSQTVSAEQVTISGFDTNTRGEQTLTAAYEGLTATFKVVVLKQGDNPNTPGGNNIRVYFTLLGDSLHGAPTGDDDTHTLAGKNLQTWIARRAVEVDLNATVKDVLEKALTEAGMTWRNPSGSYVEAITYNGVTLAEFSNGNRSGWMYTINGKHSDMAVSEQYLESGDVIIFHYTDDHTLESGSEEFGGMSGGAAGGAGGETGVVLTPGTVEGSDGKNLATMTAREITQAIEGAKKEELANIIIEPIVKGSSGNLSLSLPLDSLGDMAKEQLSLYLNSRQGSMVIAPKALEAIAKQASGIDVRLNVENKESKQEAVRAAAIEALGQATGLRGTAEALLDNAAITEITITSGGKEISQFDGQELTLYLPVANEALYSEGQSYKVVVVSGDGRVETITGKCVKRGGQLVVQVAVSHLSTFIVTTEKTAEPMSFWDVPEDSWFHEAVRFVYEAGLMNGENANEFKPNGSLNRAMLVTILYRLEQEPAVTKGAKFSDVAAGQWYSEAVIWASESGIVNGYEDGTFQPMSNVSREEMAAMLMRYAEFKQIDVSASKDISGYRDSADVAAWAKENLSWANAAGLIQGDENNKLNPQGKATRAEAATILMRLINDVIK